MGKGPKPQKQPEPKTHATQSQVGQLQARVGNSQPLERRKVASGASGNSFGAQLMSQLQQNKPQAPKYDPSAIFQLLGRG